jgi:predicted alpha-1,2-mannosidase
MMTVAFFLILICTTILSAPIDMVDPRIGTGGLGYGIGSVPPGAQVPFGLARVSPDTCEALDIVIPFDHFGGYYADDSVMRCISHLHMQGAGSVDLGVVGVMPTLSANVPNSIDYRVESWRLNMDKSTELASPGYYAIALNDNDSAHSVRVELTATQLTGVHRYTFDANAPAGLLVLPSTTIGGDNGHQMVSLVLNGSEASGFVQVSEAMSARDAAGSLTVYYWLKVVRGSVAQSGVWTNLEFVAGSQATTSAKHGSNCGAYFSFATTANVATVIEFVMGVSLVSVADARQNVLLQQGFLSFDQTRTNARQLWSTQLAHYNAPSNATTTGVWRDRQVMFWTAAYHAACAPTNYTETCGCYRGADWNVHSVPLGEAHFSDLSIWDIFRTQAPLLNFVQPNTIAAPLMRSFERFVRDGGALPRWPLGPVYTGAMVGNHANAIIADCFFRCQLPSGTFNVSLLFDAMWRSVRDPTIPLANRDAALLRAWLSENYMPDNLGESRSGAVALDWALDDALTARVAQALGRIAEAANLTATASNYRNHWKNGLFCPRHGTTWNCPSFLDSFNPFDDRYVEDDAQVYAYYVYHDDCGFDCTQRWQRFVCEALVDVWRRHILGRLRRSAESVHLGRQRAGTADSVARQLCWTSRLDAAAHASAGGAVLHDGAERACRATTIMAQCRLG